MRVSRYHITRRCGETQQVTGPTQPTRRVVEGLQAFRARFSDVTEDGFQTIVQRFETPHRCSGRGDETGELPIGQLRAVGHELDPVGGRDSNLPYVGQAEKQ